MQPDIVYEDNHVLVVIKPHNVSVQEDESKDEDMLNILKNYIKVRDNKPGNVFLGLVHRLDRPTGGLMVFAKTSKAAARLTQQLKAKQLKKKYLCVVCGTPKKEKDKLTTFLKKDEKTNTVSIAPRLEEGSKEAILEYQVLAKKGDFSLVDVNLITGRSHQIRVQMSQQLQCPIFADFKYGDKTNKGNLCLWAYELTFIQPTTKQNLKFLACPDFKNSGFKIFEKEIKNFIK